MGKVTSNNVNLRNLRYNENFFHVMLALINRNLFQLHPITLVKLLKPRFLDNFEICLLFSRKQQICITCR